MRLDSDFEDYYDRALRAHPCAQTLVRRRDSGLDRREGFARLHELGWPTVPHGTVREMCALTGDRFRLVVVGDVAQHGPDANGNDPLVLVRPAQAIEHAPDALCSLFLPYLDRRGCVMSYSHLTIGDRCFLVEYRQYEMLGATPQSWMSNRGMFDVRVIQELPSPGYLLPVPIWSVDYVMAASETNGTPIPRAFELNDAPILAGTGIESILAPQTVAELIAQAAQHHAERAVITETHEEDNNSEENNSEEEEADGPAEQQ
jgi:hypothetical protein